MGLGGRKSGDQLEISIMYLFYLLIPVPTMADVFMDLMADSTEFLTGKAHRGMALGSNNIYERCREAIIKG